MIMLPLGAISMMDEAEFGAPVVESYDDPEPQDVPPDYNRQRIARGFQNLMGGELDADGVSADIIDAGNEQLLWGASPSPDAFAIVPDLGDWTDPAAWLDGLDELDLPADLEGGIERLARAAQAAEEREGEGTVRRRFAARLGDMLRDAGLEALAVRQPSGGFDWIVLNAEDLARESDGEPWSPPGGQTASDDVRRLGVSLGQGGRVSLWPSDSAGPPEAPPLPQSGDDDEPPARQPRPRPQGDARRAPPSPPPAVKSPPRRPSGGSGLVS